jgi:predicted MFS family arabinose efflux permease
VLALLGGLGIAALLVLMPADRVPKSEQPGMRRNMRQVLTYRPAVAGMLLGLSLSAANEMVNLVFGVWMEEAFGLKIAALAAASAILGLAELAGEGLVGGLSDRLGKPRSVGIGLALNCLAVLILSMLGDSLPVTLIGLFFFYITFEFLMVSSLPMMTEVLPPARATLMALYIASLSLGRAAGDLIAPNLYRLGQVPGGRPSLLPIAAATVGFNLLALWFLRSLSAAEAKNLKAKEPAELRPEGQD